MKRSVSNRRRVRSAGSGTMLAGLLALIPAVAHAQATTAPDSTKTAEQDDTAAAPPTRPAPALPPRTPAHPAAPPRVSAPPPPPARAYPPPPPRGYPPPPPRYQNYQGYPQQNAWQGNVNQGRAPYGYYMPPPDLRETTYRPVSFSFSIGPGALMGPDESDLALTYFLRLGIGLAPNLSLVVGFEGAGANSVNPDTHLDSWLKQETFLLGLQAHFGRGIYVRGAVGESKISETTTNYDYYSGGTGVTFSGAIGYEFLQLQHLSLALDLNGSTTRYAHESWQTAGLNLAMSFF